VETKAVIFDYGEVLCHPPTPAENQRLAGFFRISVDSLPRLWGKNRGPYDRGDLTPETYWSMLAEDAGTWIAPPQLDEIRHLDVTMWSNVNCGMVEWARQLKNSGIKVGLLSNMHPEMVAHVRKQFSWIKDFDFVTFSGDVRLIKPEPAIYEHTLRGLGTKPPETIFLDDREINVQAARALGMSAIRFHSIAQLRSDLEVAGFSILPLED
jgi:putative hydrolase of the HAD superfamily